MSDRVYLVGADEVQSAGREISGAAREMRQAASEFSESVRELRRVLQEDRELRMQFWVDSQQGKAGGS